MGIEDKLVALEPYGPAFTEYESDVYADIKNVFSGQGGHFEGYHVRELDKMYAKYVEAGE